MFINAYRTAKCENMLVKDWMQWKNWRVEYTKKEQVSNIKMFWRKNLFIRSWFVHCYFAHSFSLLHMHSNKTWEQKYNINFNSALLRNKKTFSLCSSIFFRVVFRNFFSCCLFTARIISVWVFAITISYERVQKQPIRARWF